MAAQKGTSTVKPIFRKRVLNPTSGILNPNRGAPFNEQDPRRRLGNFVTAGEHARIGGRGGIIGQKAGKFTTDKRKAKK